jgi:hypothetical protein
MTSQGSASGRFTRAIQQRNLFAAEIALREWATIAPDAAAVRGPRGAARRRFIRRASDRDTLNECSSNVASLGNEREDCQAV